MVEGTEYKFRVIAENKVGCGPESDPSEPVLAKDPWGVYICNKTYIFILGNPAQILKDKIRVNISKHDLMKYH